MKKEINELLKKAWNCGSVFADDFDTNYNFDSFINREETKALIMHIVSISNVEKYAEFCVMCDRDNIPLLKYEDFLARY